MESISCHIMPLVVRHKHTHTHTHTDNPHRINFKKLGACLRPERAWFKNFKTNITSMAV